MPSTRVETRAGWIGDRHEALIAAMGHDKKVKDGQLTFILLRGLGRSFVTSDVPLDAVRDVLNA